MPTLRLKFSGDAAQLVNCIGKLVVYIVAHTGFDEGGHWKLVHRARLCERQVPRRADSVV